MNGDPNLNQHLNHRGGHKSPLRRCVVLREEAPKHKLLRFVRSPDGTLVFDIKQNLPARGVYVTPQKSLLEQAIKSKAFSKNLKQDLKVSETLSHEVEILLRQDILRTLNLADKAGILVVGLDGVCEALKSLKMRLALTAVESGADSLRRLKAAAGAHTPLFAFFEDGCTLQRVADFKHCAVKQTPLGAEILEKVRLLNAFCGEGLLIQ